MLVLIGLIDQPISKPENVSWDTNKVGGLPIWLATPPAPFTSPPCRLCGCSQTLVTQLYCPLGSSAFHRCLYIFACPRKCNTQTSGWQVFRSMQYDPAYNAASAGRKKINEYTDMDSDSWGGDADDWGEDVDDWGEGTEDLGEGADQGACGGDLVYHDDSVLTATAANKIHGSPLLETSPAFRDVEHLTDNFNDQVNITNNFSYGASSEEMEETKIRADSCNEVFKETMLVTDTERIDAIAQVLNTKHEHQTLGTDNTLVGQVVLKPYYLEVVEEPQEEENVSDHVLSLIKDYEKSEGHSLSSLLNDRQKSGKGKSGPSENYEKSELKHGDRKFHKFIKRLQRCPQQCVRYCRGGDPLLINDLESQVIDPCPACGSQREFELQLLPAILPWLQAEEEETTFDVDFGTILVFSCKNNCWEDSFKTNSHQLMEEVIILQGDPDRHLYR